MGTDLCDPPGDESERLTTLKKVLHGVRYPRMKAALRLLQQYAASDWSKRASLGEILACIARTASALLSARICGTLSPTDGMPPISDKIRCTDHACWRPSGDEQSTTCKSTSASSQTSSVARNAEMSFVGSFCRQRRMEWVRLCSRRAG
eukprot:scaffold81063_cov33-Tisochrysis_lutea.AAC.1